MGSTESCWSVLASVARVGRAYDPVSNSNRMLCELDQESDPPLWYHRAPVPGRRRAAITLGDANHRNWKRFHVADNITGIGNRIPLGVAIYVAHRIKTNSL